MLTFKNKKEVFEYIIQTFPEKAILIRGSTDYGPIKKFSDMDIEIYGKK